MTAVIRLGWNAAAVSVLTALSTVCLVLVFQTRTSLGAPFDDKGPLSLVTPLLVIEVVLAFVVTLFGIRVLSTQVEMREAADLALPVLLDAVGTCGLLWVWWTLSGGTFSGSALVQLTGPPTGCLLVLLVWPLKGREDSDERSWASRGGSLRDGTRY